MMTTFRLTFAAATLALAALATPAFAVDIDNTSGGVAFNIQPFGAPDTATYGQTFVAGGSTLTSFSLYLNGRTSGDSALDLTGYIGSWDGTKLSGLLYTSAVRTVNDTGLTELAFGTGSVAVTAGATYVAFLSVSDLPAQAESLFFMPAANGNIAGGFVYQNNGLTFGNLSTVDWNSFGATDVLFKATFDAGAAVPEAATWVMMIAGFGMIGAAKRRRTPGTATA